MSSSYSQPQHCCILGVPNYCLPTINAVSSSAEQMNHNMSHWSLCKTKSAVNRHTHLPARSTNASLPRKIWERYWFRCFLFTIISKTAWELKWVQTKSLELQQSSSYDFGCIRPALIPTELCSRNSVACSPKNLLYIQNQKKREPRIFLIRQMTLTVMRWHWHQCFLFFVVHSLEWGVPESSQLLSPGSI